MKTRTILGATASMVNNEPVTPPLYPFPGDEIIYPKRSDWSSFDTETDSYFALGKLPEEKNHVFNGESHSNSLRFVVRSPEKGSLAMLMNHGDMQHVLALALKGYLETVDEAVQSEAGDSRVSLKWLSNKVGKTPEEVFK